MTLQEIYDLAVKMGIEADPRGKKGVLKVMSGLKKEYSEMPEKKKRGGAMPNSGMGGMEDMGEDY